MTPPNNSFMIMWSCQSWQVQNPSIEPNSFALFLKPNKLHNKNFVCAGKMFSVPFQAFHEYCSEGKQRHIYLEETFFYITQAKCTHVKAKLIFCAGRHTNILCIKSYSIRDAPWQRMCMSLLNGFRNEHLS